MPHPKSERRREFLRYILDKNMAAFSADAVKDMRTELAFLNSLYEGPNAIESPPMSDILEDKISEPDPKSVEVKLEGKFNT